MEIDIFHRSRFGTRNTDTWPSPKWSVIDTDFKQLSNAMNTAVMVWFAHKLLWIIVQVLDIVTKQHWWYSDLLQVPSIMFVGKCLYIVTHEYQQLPIRNIQLYENIVSHMWIQTIVTVQKLLNWVLTSVTMTFDLDLFHGHHFYQW